MCVIALGSPRITLSLAHPPLRREPSTPYQIAQAQSHRAARTRKRALSTPLRTSRLRCNCPQCAPAVQECTAHSRSVFARQVGDLTPNSPLPVFALLHSHLGGSPGWRPHSTLSRAPHSA